MASVVDDGILNVSLSGMAAEFASSNARRTQRADQLAGDSQAQWSIAMTTPTQQAALALRTAQEAGSGRTRAETNGPLNTAAPTEAVAKS